MNDVFEKTVPAWFKCCCASARQRNDSGVKADYRLPGYHLAIHICEASDDAAFEELDSMTMTRSRDTGRRVYGWLKTHCSQFLALVPARRRRTTFLEGFMQAIGEGRLLR